jgi:hypothetical protein
MSVGIVLDAERASRVKGQSSSLKLHLRSAATHDHSEFVKAMAQVRRLAPFEGWCSLHVQAIMVSIDQYAEAAMATASSFETSLIPLVNAASGRIETSLPLRSVL